MQQISEATGETVDLAILEGNRMRFIDQVVGSQRLRTVSSIGESFPLTTTANGKATLAALNQTEATKLIIAEFEEYPDTIRDLSGLLTEIETIRAGTLARDNDEHTEGISALALRSKSQGSKFTQYQSRPDLKVRMQRSRTRGSFNRITRRFCRIDRTA